MRRFTSLLFSAVLITNLVQAQGESKAQLQLTIVEMLRTELADRSDSTVTVACTITSIDHAQSGTGAALMMYHLPHVVIQAEIALLERSTGIVRWQDRFFAVGRTDHREALDALVEQATDRILVVLGEQPTLGGAPALAHE